MDRIEYVEPEVLQALMPLEPIPADTLLIEEVEKALTQLPLEMQELVVQRIYQGKTINQIAQVFGITRESVILELNDALHRLRLLLSDYVQKRWNIQIASGCSLCIHPQNEIINRMLENKPDSESWGTFGKRLSIEIGEKIGPPRILITHLNHIKRSTNGAFGG